jgi:hypothetical protein
MDAGDAMERGASAPVLLPKVTIQNSNPFTRSHHEASNRHRSPPRSSLHNGQGRSGTGLKLVSDQQMQHFKQPVNRKPLPVWIFVYVFPR